MDSDYKELLVKIAREIKREDLETMRFLCDDFLPEANSIPQTASQSDVYIEALHFFRELKNAQKVSHENLEYLKRLLEKAKRDDLASKVEDFVSDSRSTSPEAVRPEPKIEPSEVLHSGSWTDDRTKAQTRKREKRKRYKERRREREGKLDGTGDVKEEQVHEDQTAEHNNQSQRTENQTKLSDENENQKFDEWPSLHQTTLSNFSGNKSNKRESRHHPKSLTDQQKSLTGQNGISKDGLPTTNTIKETVLNGITRPVVHKDPKDDVPRPAVYKDPKNDVPILNPNDVPILKNDVPRPAVYKDPKNDVPRFAVYKDPKNEVPKQFPYKHSKNDVHRPPANKDPKNEVPKQFPYKDPKNEVPKQFPYKHSKNDVHRPPANKDPKNKVPSAASQKDPKNESQKSKPVLDVKSDEAKADIYNKRRSNVETPIYNDSSEINKETLQISNNLVVIKPNTPKNYFPSLKNEVLKQRNEDVESSSSSTRAKDHSNHQTALFKPSDGRPSPSLHESTKRASLQTNDMGYKTMNESASGTSQNRAIVSGVTEIQDQPRCILFLCDKWHSWGESIPVFNRELCFALARAGHHVACLVLSSSDIEREEARKECVELITCCEKSGINNGDTQLFQFHDLGSLPFTPDVVVGHGKITGPAAVFYSEKIFCPRLHVIHDLPDECLKYDEIIDKQCKEEDLARTADFVAAIGTLLHEKWSTLLNRDDLIEMIPGLPKLDTRNRISSPQNRYFVPAKFCSPWSSGLRIAILAVNNSSRRDNLPRKATLMPRNTESKGSIKSSERLLKEHDKSCVELNRKDLAERKQALVDLQGATLFLSPARAEAFGVSALDAIAIGIPIVISSRSGLAYTIHKYLNEEFHACIKEVSSECSGKIDDESEDTDADVWANEIDKASMKRDKAFTGAEALRSEWNERFTWEKAAKHLMDVITRSGKLSSTSSSSISTASVNKRISDPTLALVDRLNLFNKRQKFVLFLSPAKQLPPEVPYLGLVQWAAVFDFAREESEQNSYLKCCEHFLANIGRPACRLYPPSEEEARKQRQIVNLPNGTPWILLQGSLPDMPRDVEENLDWIQEILNQMKKRHPCPLTLLIVWESIKEFRSLCRKLFKVLTVIQALPSWKNAIDVVIVSTTSDIDSRLEDIADEFHIKVNAVNLSEFCRSIQRTAIGNPWYDLNTDFSLPKLDPSSEKVLPAALPDSIRWVDSVFELLYTTVGSTPEFGKEDAFYFFRGGQISWYGIEMDYVVKRESWVPIKKAIESELEYSGAAFLTLFHQRGTGGTTSARKLLYDFHLRYPCICLKSINYDTISAIKVIWEFCGLPVLILADIKDVPGAVTNDVEALYGSLSNDKVSCLILHVVHRQNYATQSRSEQSQKEPLVLAKTLNPREREDFYEAYSLHSETKRPHLHRLRNSVNEELQIPFYYGLVAFGEEFKGLEPFVKDSLQGLNENQRQALCFVSMAYHYAQVQIPPSALAAIFNLKPRQLDSIDDILTADAKVLLIEDGYGYWRPRHYTIGKEIICQILTFPFKISKLNWKSHLADKVIEFIDFMDEDLVTAILLNRISDENTFKRFSSLIEDIPDGQDVIRVFHKAIKIHPGNPFFKAHLGRYYSVVMGIDGFDDARKYTDEGILLASAYSQNVRSQLTQMKGIVYKRQVRNKIERQAPLLEIIPFAQEGVSAFTRAVSISTENLEGAFIPQVRMMCDIFKYVNRFFRGGIYAYMLSEDANPFIRDGISETSDVLEMVTESRYYPDLRRELFQLGGHHRRSENKEDLIEYFKELKKTNKTSTASVNRQIVLIELEICKEKNKPISNIADEMIKLLGEALKYDEKIDLTMRLWVKVAPHIPETLMSAESKINTWCNKGKSVTSYLYRHIFTCIRILEGGRDQQFEDDMLIAREELHKAVAAAKRYIRHPDRPVVFLGTKKGMGQLVSPEPETVKSVRKQRIIPEGYEEQLRHLTGTITELTKKVGEIKAQGLTISFRADLCQPPLVGASKLGKKVKFYLAFNYFGADAYNVRITKGCLD